jgi:hypothetical protein
MVLHVVRTKEGGGSLDQSLPAHAGGAIFVALMLSKFLYVDGGSRRGDVIRGLATLAVGTALVVLLTGVASPLPPGQSSMKDLWAPTNIHTPLALDPGTPPEEAPGSITPVPDGAAETMDLVVLPHTVMQTTSLSEDSRLSFLAVKPDDPYLARVASVRTRVDALSRQLPSSAEAASMTPTALEELTYKADELVKEIRGLRPSETSSLLVDAVATVSFDSGALGEIHSECQGAGCLGVEREPIRMFDYSEVDSCATLSDSTRAHCSIDKWRKALAELEECKPEPCMEMPMPKPFEAPIVMPAVYRENEDIAQLYDALARRHNLEMDRRVVKAVAALPERLENMRVWLDVLAGVPIRLTVRSAPLPAFSRRALEGVLERVPDRILVEERAPDRESLVQKVYGKIKVCVRSDPSGAPMLVNDKQAGTTPGCVMLPPGRAASISLRPQDAASHDFQVKPNPSPADLMVFRCKLSDQPTCSPVKDSALLGWAW